MANSPCVLIEGLAGWTACIQTLKLAGERPATAPPGASYIPSSKLLTSEHVQGILAAAVGYHMTQTPAVPIRSWEGGGEGLLNTKATDKERET